MNTLVLSPCARRVLLQSPAAPRNLNLSHRERGGRSRDHGATVQRIWEKSKGLPAQHFKRAEAERKFMGGVQCLRRFTAENCFTPKPDFNGQHF